jgi:hypothetical protein
MQQFPAVQNESGQSELAGDNYWALIAGSLEDKSQAA